MNLRRAGGGALTLVLAALVLAPPAAASVDIKLSPRAPVVDDFVTVSWRTDRVLRPGYRYVVTLFPYGAGDGCAGRVSKTSTRRPRRGATMSMTFTPFDDPLYGTSYSGPEWCQGKASATVSVEREDRETDLGIELFRFRAKP